MKEHLQARTHIVKGGGGGGGGEVRRMEREEVIS